MNALIHLSKIKDFDAITIKDNTEKATVNWQYHGHAFAEEYIKKALPK